jgi:DNA-binding CsgD family transcriptional regulator
VNEIKKLEGSVLGMSLISRSFGVDANVESMKAMVSLMRQYNLTERENELLNALTLYGYNNRELAYILSISEKTVKNHLANIMRKTNTKSSRELSALVLRASLKESGNVLQLEEDLIYVYKRTYYSK